MKTALLLLTAALALSGCAMSAKGLAKSDVEMTVTSTKPAKDFATCAAEAMIGNVNLRNDGDHYWLLRINGYGVPMSRWDFVPTPSGSKAELRASVSINTGDERVKACA